MKKQKFDIPNIRIKYSLTRGSNTQSAVAAKIYLLKLRDELGIISKN